MFRRNEAMLSQGVDNPQLVKIKKKVPHFNFETPFFIVTEGSQPPDDHLQLLVRHLIDQASGISGSTSFASFSSDSCQPK